MENTELEWNVIIERTLLYSQLISKSKTKTQYKYKRKRTHTGTSSMDGYSQYEES